MTPLKAMSASAPETSAGIPRHVKFCGEGAMVWDMNHNDDMNVHPGFLPLGIRVRVRVTVIPTTLGTYLVPLIPTIQDPG